ncbi:AraC family transcriptional regulator [Opitutus sp. ER46]|uniref:helix-turn-helix transcriptional regulator n=1 Tax=Opitutus sp. ER46 TaxID=2161864 RepID=UPI000D30A8E1|nr:AraC family transcriptional regulator [Opitutus sp. ER46]PTX95811.1 AraC family transcriptional regulator [Opitutus sp. ER46]
MQDLKYWRNLVGRDEWYHLARVSYHPGRRSWGHTHDFAEIFWVEEGQGRHRVNGVEQNLAPGDIMFIRPRDHHRFGAADAAGFTFVNLAFPACVATEMAARFPEAAALHDPAPELPVQRVLSPHQRQVLRQELRGLPPTDRRRLRLERFLLELYALLVPARPGVAGLPDWLEQACAEMQQPDQLAGGVATFVRLAGRGAEHVARTCRRYLGLTPTAYVNSLRMEHAARELRLGAKPIVEICLECGFSNLAHFYTLFRAAQGDTPRRYRQRHQRLAL